MGAQTAAMHPEDAAFAKLHVSPYYRERYAGLELDATERVTLVAGGPVLGLDPFVWVKKHDSRRPCAVMSTPCMVRCTADFPRLFWEKS